MKETYRHELPFWMKCLGVWRVNRDSIDLKWGYFSPRFGFEFMLHRGGYFNQRYAVSICFIWGLLHVYLPFKTRIPESCDTPQYGIQIHSDTFWIHLGGKMNDWEQCDSKWITWHLPYLSWNFDFHEVWTGAEWVKASSKSYSPPYGDKRLVEVHPYQYVLKSGEVQNRKATIYMDRRQWRRKWFHFLKKLITSIDVRFDGEVGEETGAWKGGTIGCGWDVLPGQSMVETLSRMEKERKF